MNMIVNHYGVVGDAGSVAVSVAIDGDGVSYNT